MHNKIDQILEELETNIREAIDNANNALTPIQNADALLAGLTDLFTEGLTTFKEEIKEKVNNK